LKTNAGLRAIKERLKCGFPGECPCTHDFPVYLFALIENTHKSIIINDFFANTFLLPCKTESDCVFGQFISIEAMHKHQLNSPVNRHVFYG